MRHKAGTGHSLQPHLEVLEVGPLGGFVGPAEGHDAVEGGGAVGGHGQPLAVLYPADHVVVLDALEWLDAVHQDLPHAHPWEKERAGDIMNDEIGHKRLVGINFPSSSVEQPKVKAI